MSEKEKNKGIKNKEMIKKKQANETRNEKGKKKKQIKKKLERERKKQGNNK